MDKIKLVICIICEHDLNDNKVRRIKRSGAVHLAHKDKNLCAENIKQDIEKMNQRFN